MSAIDFASCVLPVPAGPSTRIGLLSLSARYATPAMPSSARYCTSRRASRTPCTLANRSVAWRAPSVVISCTLLADLTAGSTGIAWNQHARHMSRTDDGHPTGDRVDGDVRSIRDRGERIGHPDDRGDAEFARDHRGV